jgi:hypothetical protein
LKKKQYAHIFTANSDDDEGDDDKRARDAKRALSSALSFIFSHRRRCFFFFSVLSFSLREEEEEEVVWRFWCRLFFFVARSCKNPKQKDEKRERKGCLGGKRKSQEATKKRERESF